MSEAWTLVLAVGAGTVALKGAGPMLLGGREVPARVRGVLALLAPAVLAALIVTQTLAADEALVLDARAAGLAGAAVALLARAPLLVVLVVAAAIAAVVRLLGG